MGTIDAVYLAARFALIKILFSGSVRPLVILDDPFHNLDNRRKEKAKEILKEFSKNFQILLFTHSDEYDGWGTVVTI